MPKKITSSWDKPSWEWQPSLLDPGIVILRFPGWIFGPSTSEDEDTILSVRLLGPKERDAFEAYMLPLDFMGFSARLISLSLIDGKGNKLFSEKDEAEINRERSTPVFALANAILAVNGMLPPPDQNVDHGKLVSIESLKATLRKEYPSWPQEKIDGYIEFISHRRFAGPVFSFQRSYAHRYRPGTKSRETLYIHLPQVKDDERLAAAERFIGNRSPIDKNRLEGIRGEIRKEYGPFPRGEEKAFIKQAGIVSLFPSVARMREALGIFAPEKEMVRKTNYELNEETTFYLLPREGREDEEGKGTWRKKKTSDDPKLRDGHEQAVAYELEEAGIKGSPPPKAGEDAGPEDDGRAGYFFGRQFSHPPPEVRVTAPIKLLRRKPLLFPNSWEVSRKKSLLRTRPLPGRRADGEGDFHDGGPVSFSDYLSELEASLINEEKVTSEELEIAATDDLRRKLQALTVKQRKYLNAFVTAGGDYDRAAKKLKLKKPGTLRVAIHRIRLENNAEM